MKGTMGGSTGGTERSRARQKRDSRARRAEERQWASLAGEVLVSRSVRKSCTVCSSTKLQWGTVGDAVHARNASGESWDSIGDWLEQLGAEVGVSSGPELLGCDRWECHDCGEWGVFGPIQSS